MNRRLVSWFALAVVALLVILLDVFHRAETSRSYLGYISAVGLGVVLLRAYKARLEARLTIEGKPPLHIVRSWRKDAELEKSQLAMCVRKS